MSNKVGQAISNFQSKAVRPTPAKEISKAEAFGVNTPPMNEAKVAGYGVEGTLAKNKADAQWDLHKKYVEERAAYEAERDDFLWKKVLARRVAL